MASRHNAGFTLLELMVVVVIIGILLTYAIPGFGRSMADRRAASAAAEMITLIKEAQERAQNGDTAYAVYIEPGAGALAAGQVALLRGQVGRCQRQDWSLANQACPPGPVVPGQIDPCPRQLDLNNRAWFREPFAIRLREVPLGEEGDPRNALRGAGAGNVTLCFESGGAMYWARGNLAPVMAFETSNTAALGGGFVFALAGYDGTNFSGVPRVLAMPLGGTVRRLR